MSNRIWRRRSTRAGELERELADLEMTSALPEAPEEAQVEQWVLDAYRRSWQHEGSVP
jgi:hypothetical protein